MQPIDVSASTTGQVYRRIGYGGPLLDVFMLDMRRYEDPNPMTGRPPKAAGPWAPNRRSG